MRILVADDDPALRRALEHALRRDGHQVDLAASGAEALAALAQNPPDALVLDVMMPEPNGLEICRQLRQAGDGTPILLLIDRDLTDGRSGAPAGDQAEDQADGRSAGLDAGADDYLVKPFAPAELRSRLRALLWRTTAAPSETIVFADITLDTAARRATRAERNLRLTRTELALLEMFLRNPRRVLSRTQIFETVWGHDFGPDSNALWVSISGLRSKLEAEGGGPRVIQTVRGLGYVLREEP
ncbi:response regulator transcription factor [Catenulispora pinisilvae]|uniref:response regulator transcription factor n=1 Tax=Catenulispora pinisilvae TaxID=2705253 RepID=UPI0018925271|nr:response regulator transcription factor [Catenulispora pinisilvae]